jgi:response regulator NasT
MSLKIILVDANPERASALEKQLTASGFAEVRRSETADLAALIRRHPHDLIIIDMALPDRDALEDIRLVAGASPVVMFSDTDDPDFARAAIGAGVCSYNLSGVALSDIKPIMASAIALFQRYHKVEEELATAKALLEERRMLERAKAILMRDRHMSEPDAYRWLQRKAMNESRKLSQIVKDFVQADEADARERKP